MIINRLKKRIRRNYIVKSLYLFYLKSKIHIYRIIAKYQKKTIVHFLHIGKTGGSSIKYALDFKQPYINKNFMLFCHPHLVSLKDTKKGDKIFFFIRDPIERFISGFYCRKRKGLPRVYNEWSKNEEEAFKEFKTPNDLANALSDNNRDRRKRAVKAMKNIEHVRTSYWDWFNNKEYFLKRIDDILFIGTQKNLKKDFSRIKQILKIPEKCSLPNDNVNKHKNPDNNDKSLSTEAINNLKKWYEKDYAFINLLKEKNLI